MYDNNPNYGYNVTSLYKPKYICCNCRKVFKRRLPNDIDMKPEDYQVEAKCPSCGNSAINIGPKFRAPKIDNIKAWKSLEVLLEIGILHFMGWAKERIIIPESTKALKDLLIDMRANCESNMQRWLSADYHERNKEGIKTNSEIIKRIDLKLAEL